MNALVIATIKEFVEDYTATKAESAIWQGPLIGFAAAEDSLFNTLKRVVGPTHAAPSELLSAARAVVVYFLPFSKAIPKSNRTGEMASHEWADAYVQTNRLIIALNDHLAAFFQQLGYHSTVLPPTHNFDTTSLISDWSHKHVAYIAGLGNFGFHHQLITSKGCCGRLGSMITEAPLIRSERPDKEFCLNRYNGSCRVCQQRCPVDALDDSGLARQDCYQVLLKNAELYSDLGLADVCGKCASMVPCSFLNPVSKQIEKLVKATLTVEKAGIEDLPDILELQKFAYQGEATRYADPDLPPLIQTHGEMIQEYADHLFLKAVAGKRLIGSVRAVLKGDTCYIHKLVVHPDFRHQGIGRRLMTQLEQVFREVKRFELFTGHKTAPALHLYRSLGYRELKRKTMETHTLVFLEKQGAWD